MRSTGRGSHSATRRASLQTLACGAQGRLVLPPPIPIPTRSHQIPPLRSNYGPTMTRRVHAFLAARGILDGSSPGSLLGRHVYFKRDKYLVAGERITLHALEHELIRPLKEPRIHFAIVCASQSCPILQREAYTLKQLDQQLEAAARNFINDRQRNQFNPTSRRAELSSIFKWFEEDFTEAAGSLQGYLAPMIDDENVARLLEQEAFKISYLKYDWSLNGTR